jgi:hypothetical protein
VLGSSHGRVLVRFGVAAAVLLALGILVRQARAQAIRLERYQFGPGQVRFEGLPPGLEATFDAALRDPRWFDFRASVFDPRAEDRIRQLLVRHPIVREVLAVEVSFPGSARVRLAVRTPAAWFEVPTRTGKGRVLVSTDERVLDPRAYRAYLERMRVPLPVVAGVGAKAPTRAGQRWTDPRERVAEGVAAAAVAERLYTDSRGRVVATRIDVSRFPARPEDRRDGEVGLVLDDGTSVEWGRTERALAGVASEWGYAAKWMRLETLLSRQPRGPGRVVDVRFRLAGEASDPGRSR